MKKMLKKKNTSKKKKYSNIIKKIKVVILIPTLLFILQEITSSFINYRIENSIPPDNTVVEEIIPLVLDTWKVNKRKEALPVIEKEKNCIQFGLINDNDKLIYMKNIWIIVKHYEPIKEITEKLSVGLGEISEPIYLKAKLNSETGKYLAYTEDRNINIRYVKIPPDDIQIFMLNLDFVEEGIYDIAIEFHYGYGKKEYIEISDPIELVCVNNIEN